MKLAFMGSPEFSVPVLDALVEAGHEIAAVYCQPPRPAGRGKKDRPGPVHMRAAELGLEVRHPASLKGEDERAEFAALDLDAAVVVAYGLILPQAILDAPKHGCLNIHASLLPRWRGAAPIHRAIMAGDAETGICIMQMEAGLDTGPVLLREATAIGIEETTLQLHDRLAPMGARMIVQALAQLDELLPEPQAEDGVTYAEKILKDEARIDWSKPAIEVDRLIRGLSPFPGAKCDIAGEQVKLLGSRLADGIGAPGQVLSRMTIACGNGAVEITRAQRPGKKAMSSEDFLRGSKLPEFLG
ncbi:methionyl-tRNA formyltransferase [Aliiroseovarius sp. KMU-50]|uniref:Methionyl-tRNA formyltransferase n=1 Tax=Aliiroseovarius salicola TaxID=3009082 RepID=A0ABT4VY44_9RHOB|nr:methionyl-tRNA formyltransferase [Aliiroseovarius sp. KMU-50]MDA5093179.1 methionyl-tRNA formyltransferase [Aliiroseovarius sp. KMU-50]